MSAKSDRRDMLAFGIIKGSSSIVSFFGAFYLVGTGAAESYGIYLAHFSVAVILGVMMRMGADHSLLRLARSAGRSAGEAAPLRARVMKTWLAAWSVLAVLGFVIWGFGAPYGSAIAMGPFFALSVMMGRYLRSCGRPRPSSLFDPPYLHMFGVSLLCLGAPPEAALLAGMAAWQGVGMGVFVRTLGRQAPGRILRAPLFLRFRTGDLGSIYLSYTIEASFRNGLNLLVQALYGPVAFAVFNTLLKLNFVAEQAQEFQRVFRLGGGRGGEGGGGGAAGRLRRLLTRLGVGSRPGGLGGSALETAIFVGASAVANALIMTFMLDGVITAIDPLAFYILLTTLQAISLMAGPAMFAIWVYRDVAQANLLRIGYIVSFAAAIVLAPPTPEVWTLASVGLLAVTRLAALEMWRRGGKSPD